MCFGVIAAVLAIVVGFVGRGRVGRGEADNGGQALAGIICGAGGLLVCSSAGSLIVIGHTVGATS